jgi:shikimate kinase
LIFLIGSRASGKSTVARLLARCLTWDYVDADELIEARYGRRIRRIFADEGENGFRDKEELILAEICRRQHHVVATGGGVVLRPANRDRLRAAGTCVWLTADAGTLWRRISADPETAEHRPSLSVGGQTEVEELLGQRSPLYEGCADWAVDTVGRNPARVVEEILGRLHVDAANSGVS